MNGTGRLKDWPTLIAVAVAVAVAVVLVVVVIVAVNRIVHGLTDRNEMVACKHMIQISSKNNLMIPCSIVLDIINK